VRPKPLAALALGTLAAALCAAQPVSAARAPASPKHKLSVSAALSKELQTGQISAAAYGADFAAYLAAKRTLSTLAGTRHSELAAVIANLQAMASTGALEPALLPEAFLTLERNTQLWSSGQVPAPSSHVSFPGSELVWEYYPGQGVELQWLATFGEGNGYWSSHQNTQLRQLLSEAIPLAAQRAGGIAWDYMFGFDGGAPPWTSGLSQGTALQLLARASERLKEPAYLTAAQQALHLFEVAPPQGVRVATPVGALYAEYTFAPKDRILNGFIQALVGLYDYTSITHEAIGQQLFEAGDAEARAIVPLYNTGAWSLYDQFGESNLNYHELLTEFLQHLCERTRKGTPAPPATPPPAPPVTTTPAPTPAPTTPSTGTGGASAAALRPSAHIAQTAIAADGVYCTTAQQFTTDLSTPPAIALLSKTLHGGKRAGVQVSLSKISTVGLTVRQGTRVVWSNSATVGAGKPKLLWITPAKGGTFTVSLTATDLVGNFATATGTIVVSAH